MLLTMLHPYPTNARGAWGWTYWPDFWSMRGKGVSSYAARYWRPAGD
jgi:hypothetical protein